MKNLKIKSETTPNHNMQLRSYVAELMLIRQFGKHSLMPYFWRHPRFKGTYTREVRAISKFIKTYGPSAVVSVACDVGIRTFTNYAEIEFFIQKEAAKSKRLAVPKDVTEVYTESETYEDLREPRVTQRKKGIFERLNELEQDI